MSTSKLKPATSRSAFRITVPTRLDVTVQTDDGDIDLQGLSGSIDMTTTNGDIDGSRIYDGSVHVTSDNGDVDLAFSTAPDGDDRFGPVQHGNVLRPAVAVLEVYW